MSLSRNIIRAENLWNILPIPESLPVQEMLTLRLCSQPLNKSLPNSRIFRAFLKGLCTATLTIFIRSVFRVAELSGGFRGPLANNQISFMILEGAMVCIVSASNSYIREYVFKANSEQRTLR
jgi:hypothetical protein